MSILEKIKCFVDNIAQDHLHRYRSFDYCHSSFANTNNIDNQTLNLAFYLASWGMYRGSSGLLQKNHMLHYDAVKILNSEYARSLRCDENHEVSKSDIKEILTLREELQDYYKGNNFIKKGKERNINPTDTLISKIMLGALGCVPAYDRYFLEGLKKEQFDICVFNESSLNKLFEFIDKEDNKKQILSSQEYIKSTIGYYYPVMKIIDMYFWQLGYDHSNSNDDKKSL